ncbi:MAG: hypothetical protein ACMVO3_09880 [Thalassobaculum sp.]
MPSFAERDRISDRRGSGAKSSTGSSISPNCRKSSAELDGGGSDFAGFPGIQHVERLTGLAPVDFGKGIRRLDDGRVHETGSDGTVHRIRQDFQCFAIRFGFCHRSPKSPDRGSSPQPTTNQNP